MAPISLFVVCKINQNYVKAHCQIQNWFIFMSYDDGIRNDEPIHKSKYRYIYTVYLLLILFFFGGKTAAIVRIYRHRRQRRCETSIWWRSNFCLFTLLLHIRCKHCGCSAATARNATTEQMEKFPVWQCVRFVRVYNYYGIWIHFQMYTIDSIDKIVCEPEHGIIRLHNWSEWHCNSALHTFSCALTVPGTVPAYPDMYSHRESNAIIII